MADEAKPEEPPADAEKPTEEKPAEEAKVEEPAAEAEPVKAEAAEAVKPEEPAAEEAEKPTEEGEAEKPTEGGEAEKPTEGGEAEKPAEDAPAETAKEEEAAPAEPAPTEPAAEAAPAEPAAEGDAPAADAEAKPEEPAADTADVEEKAAEPVAAEPVAAEPEAAKEEVAAEETPGEEEPAPAEAAKEEEVAEAPAAEPVAEEPAAETVVEEPAAATAGEALTDPATVPTIGAGIVPQEPEAPKEPEPEFTKENKVVPDGFEFEKVNKIFMAFDHDLSGMINAAELADALRCLGLYVSQKEVKSLCMQLHFEHLQVIKYDQFCQFLTVRKKDSKDRLRKAFKRFDMNGDGVVDTAELRRCLTTMGEALTHKQVDDMLAGMDINEDDKIDFDEFVNYMLGEQTVA